MFRVTTDVSCPAAKAIDEAINPDINAQLEEAVEGGLDDECQDIEAQYESVFATMLSRSNIWFHIVMFVLI